MKLHSVQVYHCFGFGDSGPAELTSPSGIVTILGRNSSGKSSLLSAIGSLNPDGEAPNQNLRFENFYDPSGKEPYIWAEISVGTDAPVSSTIVGAVRSHLREKRAPEDFLEGDASLGETLEKCGEQLEPLFRAVAEAGCVYVYRRGPGHFGVTAPGETAEHQTARKNVIDRLLSGIFAGDGSLRRGPATYPVEMHTARFLHELARLYLPPIYLFGDRFQLQSNLPDRITPETIAKPQEGLVDYWLGLLGLSSLKEFFAINDPDRRNELLSGFNVRLSELADLVNEGAKAPMIGFVLHEKDGLQLTTKVDGKKSFYRHISDNTKFLVGYNLVTHGGKLRPSVLLFDEPNTGFHPTAQRQLLVFLERLSAHGHQVVLTTHSEHLLDLRHISGTRIMMVDSNYLLRVENHPLSRRLTGNAALALQPLMDAIGQTHGGPFPLSKSSRVILLEGITDLMHLRALSKLLDIDLAPMLIPGRGESTLPTIAALCLGQGLEVRFVLDKGDSRRILGRDYLVPDEAVFEIPPQGSHRTSGIEDLYTKADFAELLRRCGIAVREPGFSRASNCAYVKGTAKTIVAQRAMLEDLDFLTSETRNSFSRVFAFIGAEGVWFKV